MNKAQLLLEQIDVAMNRPTEDEIFMRMNYRHSTRCPHCGRCLSRIHQLPAVRTCPNGECGNRYEINKVNRGLIFKRV